MGGDGLKYIPFYPTLANLMAAKLGKLTEVRALMKNQPARNWDAVQGLPNGTCMFYDSKDADFNGYLRKVQHICHPGDVLYFREAWTSVPMSQTEQHYFYRADELYPVAAKGYYPPVNMPREACRFLFVVEQAIPQQVSLITEEQAWAEGYRSGQLPYKESGAFYASSFHHFLNDWNAMANKRRHHEIFAMGQWTWRIVGKVIKAKEKDGENHERVPFVEKPV